MTLYKITGLAGEPLHGGSGTWSLPVGKRPGKWMPKIADVQACSRGYHLTPAVAIIDWLPPSGKAAYLFEAEGRGDQSSDGEKIAFAQARLLKPVGILDEVSMRLAAADFAERVLPIFERERPDDKRPRLAIETWARDWLESDEGHDAACRYAFEDLVEARERAAEYRREA